MAPQQPLNTAHTVWISGWASDISQWSGEIHARYPHQTHTLIDYGQLIAQPDLALAQRPELTQAGHVIAWSMGSLALLHTLPLKPAGQLWTLITPIADFCAPHGGWPHRNVQLMARQIIKRPQQTLEQFAQLMGPTDANTMAKWLERAQCYTPERLALGLNYLLNNQVDTAALVYHPDSVRCLWGSLDQIVSPEQRHLFNHPHTQIVEGAGHWLSDYFDNIKSN